MQYKSVNIPNFISSSFPRGLPTLATVFIENVFVYIISNLNNIFVCLNHRSFILKILTLLTREPDYILTV